MARGHGHVHSDGSSTRSSLSDASERSHQSACSSASSTICSLETAKDVPCKACAYTCSCKRSAWMKPRAKFLLTKRAMIALADSLSGIPCPANSPNCVGSRVWMKTAPCSALQAYDWYQWREFCTTCCCASRRKCCCPPNRRHCARGCAK